MHKGRPWTAQEDEQLAAAVAVHGQVDNWKAVATCVPGRTNKACRKRWLHSLSPSVKKTAWSKEEDSLLMDLYQVHAAKWAVIARNIPGRTDDACSKRYREALDPSLKKDDWTPAEDESLVAAHSRLGGRWGRVGQELQRSGLGCRNRWRLLERKRLTAKPAPMIDPGTTVPFDLGSTSYNFTAIHVDHYSPPIPHAPCLEHAACSLPSYAAPALPIDPFYPPRLDVTPLLCPDPLALSESYPYAHHRDPSRPRVAETLHAQEQHAEYHHIHVHPPLAESQYVPSQPDAGPSVLHYYAPDPVLPSQLVQRTVPSPRPMPMPYPNRPDSTSTISDDYHTPSSHPTARRKIGTATCRKRPDTQAPLRLSSDLPAAPDSSIKPYACGHESCWPSTAPSSHACYPTSRGLSEHNKTAHPEDSGGDRPYRCGLEGCGKSWKSINGLQYHLQISKAHFQHAISSSFVSSYISDLAVPASVEASTSSEGEDRTRKQYKCPHENCPNRYKQLSGLRYHLAHGHPVELPKQLDLVPPALTRKLVEKMRAQGSSERQTADGGAEPSAYAFNP